MLTKLALILTALSAAATTALAKEETIKNIVVFGDSYSDVGNHQRLTNGPVWSEHLAVGWNASLYSFAFSGAVCNNDMYSNDNFIPSITDQVEMFYSQKSLRALDMEETAIIFWIGVNDVFKMFEKNGNDDTAALEQDYQRVVDCIGTNIVSLWLSALRLHEMTNTHTCPEKYPQTICIQQIHCVWCTTPRAHAIVRQHRRSIE